MNEQKDPGMTFLGMSGGILMLVIAGVIVSFGVLILFCCVGLPLIGVFAPTE